MAKWENDDIFLRDNSSIHAITRRHTSYVSGTGILPCHYIETMKVEFPTSCDFVLGTESCRSVINYFNYLQYLTCNAKIEGDVQGRALVFIIMMTILLILFLHLIILSKYFILPNVVHVAQYMNLPLYEYGLTIVPMVIMGPDIIWIFHYCTEVTKSNTLVYADLVGNTFATFATGLATLCLCECSIPGWRGYFQLLTAFIIFIVTYMILQQKLDTIGEAGVPELDIYPFAFTMLVSYILYIVYVIIRSRKVTSNNVLNDSTRMSIDKMGCSQIWYPLNPFKHLKLQKWIIAIITPFWIFSALQIPVIDKNRIFYGWSKYLFCFQTIIFPFQFHYGYSFDYPIFSIITGIMCFSTLLITLIYTRASTLPRFLGLYSFFGMLISVYVICVIEGEIETIFWQTMGFVYNTPLDTTVLGGFSLRAVATSAVLTHGLAKSGFCDLACGVFVGLVLNRTALTLPILSFQGCFNYDFSLVGSASTITCIVFFMIAYGIAVFIIPMFHFKLRHGLGWFLLAFYGLYYLYLTLEAYSVIHTMGSYHSIGGEMLVEHSDWA